MQQVLPPAQLAMFTEPPRNTKIIMINDPDSQNESIIIFRKYWNTHVVKQAYLEPNMVVNG